MSQSILVIRLGAMGDILHALPAVASLKLSFPESRLSWLVAERWMPLLEGNPFIDDLIAVDERARSLWAFLRTATRQRPDLAIDFQGLLKSALAGRVTRPGRFLGFDRTVAREPLASFLYSDRIPVRGPHRIERNLQLAKAAGATRITQESWIPAGRPEGDLPQSPFVLASPFAGWGSKQWPLEHYNSLGLRFREEGLQLLLNVPQERACELKPLDNVQVHSSSLAGLIFATRAADAVIGVDSGPLHLAAALGKPGVALFGPTDPAQTGPFRSRMTILRAESATTTYKRQHATDASMKDISVAHVWDALARSRASLPELRVSASGRS